MHGRIVYESVSIERHPPSNDHLRLLTMILIVMYCWQANRMSGRVHAVIIDPTVEPSVILSEKGIEQRFEIKAHVWPLDHVGEREYPSLTIKWKGKPSDSFSASIGRKVSIEYHAGAISSVLSSETDTTQSATTHSRGSPNHLSTAKSAMSMLSRSPPIPGRVRSIRPRS